MKFSKKEKQAWENYYDMASKFSFGVGQAGTGVLSDYAKFFIKLTKGKCTPREILDSFVGIH